MRATQDSNYQQWIANISWKVVGKLGEENMKIFTKAALLQAKML